MIGKGAQYLTAAGFGRYRITAASLGSLVMLGKLGWLMPATKQAIMSAFGVDGTAVIAATNDYLIGIAASDKAKATALAGFINEDPMMVCSLPLVISITMPKRYLVGDGNSYIDTGLMLTKNCKLWSKGVGINDSVFGTHCGSDYGYALLVSGNNMLLYQGGSYTGWISVTRPTEYDVYCDYSTLYMDFNGSITQRTNNGHADARYTWLIMSCRNNSGGVMAKGTNKIEYIKLEDTANYWFVPYKVGTNGLAADKVSTGVAQAAGAKGMLDIVNCIFYPNAGTGQFTIPDISYTPTP